MNVVFTLDELPDRRLAIHTVVSLDHHKDIGHVLSIVKEKMARQLAAKILDSEHFFKLNTKEHNGLRTADYFADCIVLTVDEYAQLKQEAFAAGARHAQGFMPAYN